MTLFSYDGKLFPDYIKHGNAMQFIAPTALQFCKGKGLDVGAGKWPLPGAVVVDEGRGFEHSSALNLPDGYISDGNWDYVFSSHCLEHLINPVAAIEHWKTKLRAGGVLFLYLPHPDMTYWRPQNCRKHLHMFWPQDVVRMLADLGFVDILHGERDLAWSFAVVGFNGRQT